MKLNLKNALILCVLSTACATEEGAVADFLLIGGQVIDGSGSDPVQADLAVTGDLISFLGDAASAGMQARDTVQVQDMATYEAPHQYSEGTVHVFVNGVFSIRDGEVTVGLAGKPLMRAGRVFDGLD